MCNLNLAYHRVLDPVYEGLVKKPLTWLLPKDICRSPEQRSGRLGYLPERKGSGEYLQGRKGQKASLDCDRKPENLRYTSVERHVSLLPEAREIT